MNAERERLEQQRRGSHAWDLWGPYLAERAWGTVREDYSADGDAWNYFPFDHAVSRAYRWNEDGLSVYEIRLGEDLVIESILCRREVSGSGSGLVPVTEVVEGTRGGTAAPP